MASGPLRGNREFRLLWTGQTASELGSQMSLVAYPLLVLAVTGSPARAGIVGFAKWVPVAALSLPAGELADRLDRKRLMLASNIVRAIALASIPILLWAGTVPYALIVAVAFIDGSGFVVSYVAERGALRQLVDDAQLHEAVARNESRTFGAMLAGPPLGGLLFGLARALPFACDVISYLASSVGLLLIRTDFQESRIGSSPGQVRDGLRWLWQRPFFRGCALLFAASNPIYTGLYLLIVVLAKDHGASAGLVGVMLGIAAGGGLLGALLAPALQRRISPRQSLIGESWLLALGMPLLLVAHNALLLGAIVAAGELVTPLTNSIVVGYRVAGTPDRLQGRVQAASTLLAFSAGWAGPLFAGFMIQSAGTTATVVAFTAWAALLAVIAAGSPAFRHPPPHIGGPGQVPVVPAGSPLASDG